MAPMPPLFREEVVAGQRRRLAGSVIARQTFGSWMMVGSTAALVCAAVIWASLASYTRVAHARAVLVTSSPAIKVVTPRVAVVQAMPVREGDLVDRGQIVASLSSEQSDATSSIEARSVVEAQRLLILAQQKVGVGAGIERADRQALQAGVDGLEAQASLFRVELNNKEQALGILERNFDRFARVFKKGFLSQTDYDMRQGQVIQARSDVVQVRMQIAQNATDLAKARAALSAYRPSSVQRALDGETTVIQARQRLAELNAAHGFVVKSPVRGVVTAILAEPGNEANPARPLLTILPVDASLTAEIYVSSAAIGFVRTGQRVLLSYDAFPRQEFGSFAATIVSISRTVILPGERDVGLKLAEPTYRIVARLERSPTSSISLKQLRPGMTADASITLEKRSLLSWLVK